MFSFLRGCSRQPKSMDLYVGWCNQRNHQYIVVCQAHPALVKIDPVLVPSFYF